MRIRSYPTIMLLSPRYGMTAQWTVTVDMEKSLPDWIRSTKFEWEGLERCELKHVKAADKVLHLRSIYTGMVLSAHCLDLETLRNEF